MSTRFQDLINAYVQQTNERKERGLEQLAAMGLDSGWKLVMQMFPDRTEFRYEYDKKHDKLAKHLDDPTLEEKETYRVACLEELADKARSFRDAQYDHDCGYEGWRDCRAALFKALDQLDEVSHGNE